MGVFERPWEESLFNSPHAHASGGRTQWHSSLGDGPRSPFGSLSRDPGRQASEPEQDWSDLRQAEDDPGRPRGYPWDYPEKSCNPNNERRKCYNFGRECSEACGEQGVRDWGCFYDRYSCYVGAFCQCITAPMPEY